MFYIQPPWLEGQLGGLTVHSAGGGWDRILFPFHRAAKENVPLHLEASTGSQLCGTPAGASDRSSGEPAFALGCGACAQCEFIPGAPG